VRMPTASAVNELTLEVARLRKQWADSQTGSRLVRSSFFRCPLPCYLTFYLRASLVCTDEENLTFHMNRNPTVHNAAVTCNENTCLSAHQHTYKHERMHTHHPPTHTHTHTHIHTHTHTHTRTHTHTHTHARTHTDDRGRNPQEQRANERASEITSRFS
jgi:hypothetical protein